MRRGLVLLLLTLAGGTARADEPPKPPAAPPAAPAPAAPTAKPAPPPTPEQAADVVLAAVKVKDDAALKALAAKDAPDPWIVADELISRAEFDALIDLARGAEVLISECASRDDKLDIHMNLVDDMPRVQATMGPDAHLLLTHLGPGIDSNNLPRTTVAQDFQTYRF